MNIIMKLSLSSFLLLAMLWTPSTQAVVDCRENCFEGDLDGDGIKEIIRLEAEEPSTLQVKIVGKAAIPITHNSDLQVYQLLVNDRDNDNDLDIAVDWTNKKGLSETKILQNDGKGTFKDVTSNEGVEEKKSKK